MMPSSSGSSYPAAATPAPAATSGPPSSTASPETTASANPRLAGYAATGDGDWSPGEAEAQQALDEISRYCSRYCPVRLQCVEDACRLYRVEGAALAALGYHRNAATAAVGVQSQPITGI